MNIGLEQQLRLELRLHPQLLLMLKLLPMTALELDALVRHELEQNPALEEASELPESSDVTEVPEEAESAGDDFPAREESRPEDYRQEPQQTAEAGLISETEEGPGVASRETAEFLALLDSEDYYSTPREESVGGSDDPMDLTPAYQGLAESLLPGLRAVLEEEEAQVAEVVLQSLDPDGFLTVSPGELAESNGLDPAALEAVLDRIRHIEPGGIACCSRPEALFIQLELQGYAPDSLECRLVSEFWALLLEMQFGKIARLSGASEEAVRRAAEAIHGLEMRPARRFSGRAAEYVSPDFSVAWCDGEPQFEYNDDREPRLRLARHYVEMLRNPGRYTREQVDFARGKYNRAMMFLKAIESRRQTLRRLMRAIIELQGGFFEHGPEHLRPATHQDAAELVKVHASTISRAAAGKYVETEFGIFPMKHFFQAGAGDKSRISIKEFVRQMVEAEDPGAPLADGQIATRLEAERGIKVSRRTVTKYRTELGLPGCRQRGGA